MVLWWKEKSSGGAGGDLDVVEHEDQWIVESCNRGMKSSALSKGAVFAIDGNRCSSFPQNVDRLTSEFVICRCPSGYIAVLVNDNRGSLFPAGAVA